MKWHFRYTDYYTSAQSILKNIFLKEFCKESVKTYL